LLDQVHEGRFDVPVLFVGRIQQAEGLAGRPPDSWLGCLVLDHRQKSIYLDLGLPKAEALQATRLAFATGTVHLKGDRVVGETGELLSGLTADQKARIFNGLKHPYYWAGISMLGSAW